MLPARLLAHPLVDAFLRACLYLIGGGLVAFAAFLGLVCIRVYAGFPPLPRPWYPLTVVALLVGGVGAVIIYVLHRVARRRWVAHGEAKGVVVE